MSKNPIPSPTYHENVKAPRRVYSSAIWCTPTGNWVCCAMHCGKTNTLNLNTGEYLFPQLKCACKHILCRGCSSDILDLDPEGVLQFCNPVNIEPYKLEECPYFSICPSCGLTYRAYETLKRGLTKSKMAIEFKPDGSLCDFCRVTVDRDWIRCNINPSHKCSVDSQQPVKTADSLRSKKLIPSDRVPLNRTEFGDHESIPFDFVYLACDEGRHIYRDNEGAVWRTQPGTKYGPFERLN